MTAPQAVRVALACLLLACGTAHAQLFRAYIASDGSDANPCTLAQPCRLLPAALAAVADGGEIWMLDSANYNTATVSIIKSVSILAVPGAVGSIVALSGGAAVSIATSGLRVTLRNVSIGPLPGAPAGTHGVEMNADSTLTIEESLIANLPGNAVMVGGFGKLRVADSTLRNNGEYAVNLADEVRAVVVSTRMLDNGNGGVTATGGSVGTVTTATVSDSVMSGGQYGVAAYAFGNATMRISVQRCTIKNTNAALSSATANVGIAEVSVGGSLIVDNYQAWFQSGTGSTLYSLLDNQMWGNTTSFGNKTALLAQ
jgi:hypothetical protein